MQDRIRVPRVYSGTHLARPQIAEPIECEPHAIRCPRKACGAVQHRVWLQAGKGVARCDANFPGGPNGRCGQRYEVYVRESRAVVFPISAEDFDAQVAEAKRKRHAETILGGAASGGEVPGPPQPAPEVTVAQAKVLRYLCEHGAASAAEVGRGVSMPRTSALDRLRELAAVNAVRMTGATRGAVWYALRCELVVAPVQSRAMACNPVQSEDG